MEAAQRRSQLLEIVRRQGFSSLTDLADSLQVSESTVRRDLAQLEKQGSTRRVHGGAFYSGPSPHMKHFQHRQGSSSQQKKAIAVVAAQLIEDGDTVLLDAGSTVYEVARLLVDRPVQVVTNSLPVANLLGGSTTVDLVVLGGYVHNRSGAMHGGYTDQVLSSIHVRRLLMGAGGITERGLFNNNELIAHTQRAMLQTAEEVIVVADGTKFGHQSLSHICELSDIDRMVVDADLDSDWKQMIASADIDMILTAEADETTINEASSEDIPVGN